MIYEDIFSVPIIQNAYKSYRVSFHVTLKTGMASEFSFAITGINYNFKYIEIENSSKVITFQTSTVFIFYLSFCQSENITIALIGQAKALEEKKYLENHHHSLLIHWMFFFKATYCTLLTVLVLLGGLCNLDITRVYMEIEDVISCDVDDTVCMLWKLPHAALFD